jgi:hypothetical protein
LEKYYKLYHFKLIAERKGENIQYDKKNLTSFFSKEISKLNNSKDNGIPATKNHEA